MNPVHTAVLVFVSSPQMRRLGLQDITAEEIRLNPRGQARQASREHHQNLTFNNVTANESRFVIRKENRWRRLT